MSFGRLPLQGSKLGVPGLDNEKLTGLINCSILLVLGASRYVAKSLVLGSITYSIATSIMSKQKWANVTWWRTPIRTAFLTYTTKAPYLVAKKDILPKK
jgi:hypothetical protein